MTLRVILLAGVLVVAVCSSVPVVHKAIGLAAQSKVVEAIGLLEGYLGSEGSGTVVGGNTDVDAAGFDFFKLLGNLYFLLDNLEEASRHYTTAIATAETDPRASVIAVAHMEGRVAYARGEYALALDKFRRTTSSPTFQNHVGAVYDLGCCQGCLGEYEAAESTFWRTLEMCKFDESMSCLVAARWLKWGGEHRGRARSVLDKCMMLVPDSARAHNALGQVLQDGGQYKEARHAYTTSLAAAPLDARVWYNLGTALAEDPTEAFDSCVEAYQRAVEIDNSFSKAWVNLGMTYKSMAMWNLEIGVSCGVDAGGAGGTGGGFSGTSRRAAERDLCASRKAFTRAITCAGGGRLEAEAAEHGLAVVESALYALTHPDEDVGAHVPKAASRGYLLQAFDGTAADTFNARLLDRLHYTSHTAISDALAQFYADRGQRDTTTSIRAVLDLGCGTGLSGMALREHRSGMFRACAVDGVDIAPSMCAHARALPQVYTSVITDDIESRLSRLCASGQRYDLVVSTDALIYMGPLESVFDKVDQLLDSETGVLALTLEALSSADPADFRLLLSGRYAHSERYVRGLAERRGLEVYVTAHSTRTEGERHLPGHMWLLSRPLVGLDGGGSTGQQQQQMEGGEEAGV